MSRKWLPLWSIALVSFIAGTLFAQDAPDPRKWNQDPRTTGIQATSQPASIPKGDPNYVHKNTTPKVVHTPYEALTVNPNIRVHPSATTSQSEVPITRHPTNGNILYASSNAVHFTPSLFISEGMYLSTDGGTTWFGSDTTASAPIGGHSGDPAPAIGPDGRLYMSMITSGMGVTYSTDMGATWAANFTLATGSQDKNHTFVNDVPASPYYGRAYVTWSLFTAATPPAVVSWSSNGGVSWNGPVNVLAPPASHYQQGVNGAVGANGDAYICWQNPVTASPFTGDFVGFGKSTDGGVTWSGSANAYDCNGIRGTLPAKGGIRTNDFPSMAVDRSGGGRNGWIYIVTGEKNLAPAGSDPDITLHRSSDGGTTWSPGIRVNQDALNNGKTQWQPWVCVDAAGGVNVVYYDDRNTSADSAETFVSRSLDGGTTWTDILVSDHRFKPFPIPGLAGGYQGDYIGITAANGKIYPYWADNSTGIYQAWVTSVTTTEGFGWAKGTITNVSGGAALANVTVDFTNPIQQVPGTSTASGLYYAGAKVDTPATTANVTLRARKFGFRDTVINITITRGDTLTRDFAMTPVANGTLVVRTVRTDSSNIRSGVNILFNGSSVATGFTDSLTGLYSTILPLGSYDVLVDPPSPYGNRRFDGVTVASGSTPLYVVVRKVVENAPAAMRDTLAVGQVHAKTLQLTNTTTDPVPYRLTDDNALAKMRVSKPAVQPRAIPINAVEGPKDVPPAVHGSSPTGSGGPDAFGYRWIDSDEPGGPTYNWVEISTVGTAITGLGDDTNVGPFPIGFSFPFYGNNYTNIRFCSNGWISFTSTSNAYINGPIPSAAEPNNAIYPFWDDHLFSATNGGRAFYYYDAPNTQFIVQYDSVPHYGTTELGTYTYQVILRPNGEVVAQYRRMVGTLNSATIGIENADGSVALQVVSNAAYIHDNLALKFYLPDAGWISENPFVGTIPASSTSNITVTFDANGLLQGTTYNANIIMDVTHPDVVGSSLIPASLRVISGVGPVISVSPASLTFPTTIIGSNRRDSVRVRNVGSTTLNITSVTTTNARYAATATSSSITAGDSARVRVVYTPVIPAGSDTGRIIILSNDPANPRVDVILNGTSIGAPLFRARIDTLVRAAMQSGTRDSIRFYVRNAGTAAGNYAARAIMYPRTLAPGMSLEPIIIPMDVRVERMTPANASQKQVARGPVHQNSNSQMADRSPFNSRPSFPPQSPLAQFDLQFDHDASIITGAAGNAGAVFINNEFWTSRWATGVLHRWTSSGTLIEQFTIAGVTGVRGLTTDGTFLYASTNTAAIRKIDPVTKTLVSTITCAGAVTTRVIAYDPVRDGFWVSNFADALSCVNRSGAVIATIPNTLAAKYGGAYDNYTAGGPYLWVFDQTNTAGGSPQNIWQFNLTTLTATGVAFDVLTRVTTGGATPIAGGLFITTGLVPGKATIGGMLQGLPDRLFGLELADAAGSAEWLSIAPTSGGPMAVDDSVLFSARFDASNPLIYNNPGNYFGRIEINSPGSPGPDTLKLPVRMFVIPSPGADLVVSPDTVDIGNVEIGSTDSSETVLVRNIGGSALTVTNVTFAGAAGFSSSRTSFTLASLDTLRIKVKFTATVPGGVRTARMNFTCNDPSPQSVGLRAVSLGVAHIVASPDSFFFSRPVGTDTTTANLKIRNPGTDTLRYNINETTSAFDNIEPQPIVVHEPYDLPKGANDPHPPYMSPQGAGGPDAFGYRWIDSDEPGGPAFNWVDISSTGVALDSTSAWVLTGTNRPGDEGYVAVLLPFSFSFYGVNKDTIFIGTNGNVMFQRPTGDIFTNVAFPTAAGAIDNHIGIFWDDLEVRAGARVYYGTSGGSFVVQYQGIARFAGTVPNYTFEIILSPGGLIKMQYLAMGINAGIVNSASIGIENSTGSIGLQTVFNAAYMHNNLAIIYTSDLLPWLTTDRTSGTVAPGDSQNVQLRVVGNQPPGSYVGHLRVSGNTPDVANIGVRLNIITDIQTEGNTIPTVFALNQNYPNPFNPTTRITYDLPEQATVSLKIYNLLGQEVATLANGPQAPGRYEAVWEGRNNFGNQVSSGVYFYRFEATSASGQSFANLKKMLFLK